MDISEQLFERAKGVLPGGVNSPVRAYRAVGMAPRFITRADGAYIYDEDGKRSNVRHFGSDQVATDFRR